MRLTGPQADQLLRLLDVAEVAVRAAFARWEVPEHDRDRLMAAWWQGIAIEAAARAREVVFRPPAHPLSETEFDATPPRPAQRASRAV